MEERLVKGRRCTNRPGAAEYLGRSLQTVNLLASPKRREAVGWPNSVGTADGQAWYALDDLDAFREAYWKAKQRDRRARVHAIALDGDPDDLISAKDFYTLINVDARTWSKYVEKSIPAWLERRDGYLPKPDKEEPARRGVVRYWKRHRAEAWINSRTGSASSTGRPRRHAEPNTEK